MRRKDYLLSLLFAGALAFGGCNSEPPSPTSAQPTATPAASGAAGGGSTVAVGHGAGAPSMGPAGGSTTAAPGAQSAAGPGSAGGVTWKAPSRWTLGPERSMRAATYMVPAAGGDPEGGECAVFFFGPGQGGSVQANIDRWIGQFEQPDGKPSAERAKQNKEQINGLPVTTVDLTGTFAGGGPMMGSGAKKNGYRLLGAIVEGPQGVVFFKLTGPAATVAAASNEFQTLLKSIGQ